MLTRLIVDLPSAPLLPVFEASFVPESAIGMVALPRTVLLLIIVKAARPPHLACLEEPLSATNDLSVFETAGGLHLTVVEKVLPLP